MIPTVGAEFVCRMEDVLDLYAEPHDPARPVVCFDETSKQLVAETRTPLPMKPGKPERVDYEYERRGTANLFLVTQPLGAWRHVDVTDRRTKQTSPSRCATWSIATSRRPRRSGSCSTT